MIIGTETNIVFLSDLLNKKPYNTLCKQLISIFNKHNIPYKYLKNTKDIWCRDYMPIQIDKNHFVQFIYAPSYLTELNKKSDPELICKTNNLNLNITNSKIKLDGGNIVCWSDRVIISERIFDENPEYINRQKLIKNLENLLKAEVIIIPQIHSDFTGHADGYVRFVNKNVILGNNRKQEYKYWTKKLEKILKFHQIEYIDIPFIHHKIKGNNYHAIGCYVNYLEVGSLIVLPAFKDYPEINKKVLNLFKTIFPDRKIETIESTSIGIEGGLLNCITWNIQYNKVNQP